MDISRRHATQHPTRRWWLRLPRRVGASLARRTSLPAATTHQALPRHPVVLRLDAERAADLQLRLADRITAFVGSMPFVYVHALAFATWMVVFEPSPWPTLTLVVSLEAIFLSTFVMIGQNRQAAFQQAKADHDFIEQEQKLQTNTELTQSILRMTSELHERALGTDPQGLVTDPKSQVGSGDRLERIAPRITTRVPSPIVARRVVLDRDARFRDARVGRAVIDGPKRRR